MAHTRGAALIAAVVLLATFTTACGGPVAAPTGPAAAPAADGLAAAQTATARECGTSGGTPLCVSVPVRPSGDAGSGEVRGEVAVTVTAASSFDELDFSWGPTPETTKPVFVDFAAPWGFRWPTRGLPDGAGYLVVRAAPAATGLGQPVALRLTIANGDAGNTTTAAVRDWAGRFRPRPLAAGSGPLIAAVGDGGDGTALSDAVAAYVERSPANVLLYLGDIYETGTPAEWENNFGTPSWADNGRGLAWGRLAGFTQPVLGNHEAHYRDVWRAYWRGRPLYSTFVYGGVRFLLLDSECGRPGPFSCWQRGAQYRWAQRVLATNTYRCVVAVWHRPILSPGPVARYMTPLWQLIADNGGDLVLNGHQHHMQAYRPLDGALRAGRPGSHLVELVAGSGGHILHRDVSTDPRSQWQAMGVPGALFIAPTGGRGGHATRLSYVFKDIHHRVVRTRAGAGAGSVTC
jgi:hypothetical protein